MNERIHERNCHVSPAELLTFNEDAGHVDREKTGQCGMRHCPLQSITKHHGITSSDMKFQINYFTGDFKKT